MSPSCSQPSRHAFTLLELLAAVVIMGIISAVLVPVISSASETYTTTRDVRTRTERTAHGLDRIIRIIRQAPIGSGGTGIGVAHATTTSLEFTDGTGFQFSSGTIEMLVPGMANATLCTGIDDLQIDYIGDDGRTSTLAEPSTTHRIVVTVTSGDLIVSVIAHPRVWIGQEGI